MKNRRRLIIAVTLAVLLAVSAILYFTVLEDMLAVKVDPPAPPETAEGESVGAGDRIEIFKQVTRENLKSLSVTNQHGSYEFVLDKNKEFCLKGHEDLAIDKKLFSELITVTGYPLTQSKIDSSAEEFEQYGLNDPIAFWTVNDIHGNSYTVKVGHKLLTDEGYYVCLEGRNAVYELTGSLEHSALAPVEEYITPTVTVSSQGNEYFNIKYLTIYRGSDKFVSFSLLDKADMTNPDALAENTVTYPTSYTPNSDVVWEVYAIMSSLGGERVEVLDATEADYDKYGLSEPAYTVTYEYNGATFVTFFSERSEDGYYYASSNVFPQLITKVPEKTVEFLSYDLFKFLSIYPFEYYLTQIAELKLDTGVRKAEFSLAHTKDEKGKDVLHVTSSDGTDFEPEKMNYNFRIFYRSLISIEMIDYADISAEEKEALVANKENSVFSFSAKTFSGKELKYEFYPYSTRRCLMTVNGVGEFYVLIDRLEKMISDTEKLFSGVEIDSYAKN